MTHRGVLPFVPDVAGPAGYHADLWRAYLHPFLVGVSTKPTADGSLPLDSLIGGGDVYNQGQSMMAAAQMVPLLFQVSKSAELRPDEQAAARRAEEDIFNQVKDVLGAWLSAGDD
jgi:hypothetical protein